jgi:uncharacterized protein DUF4159
MKKIFATVVFIAMLAGGAFSDSPPKKNPEFVFARLSCSNREADSWKYWPDYFPDNPPWHHDYPFADELIVSLMHELTGISVTPDAYKIVRLDSPDIFQYPFLYLSEPGFMILTDKEVANLGEYIRRGGFIMADDFRTGAYLGRGDPEELEVLRYYLKKALPERDLVRLDISHPIFHSYYDIDTLKMKPPYGEEMLVPQFWGMSDEHGRLQVIANYNNDIGDFWKYLDMGDKPLDESTRAIRLTINYIFYAMTH